VRHPRVLLGVVLFYLVLHLTVSWLIEETGGMGMSQHRAHDPEKGR